MRPWDIDVNLDQLNQLMTDWLSTDEALTRLRVRPQTLYAYVSRGRVRAEPDPAEPRRSRYRASDVAALTERKARGRKAADVARAATWANTSARAAPSAGARSAGRSSKKPSSSSRAAAS